MNTAAYGLELGRAGPTVWYPQNPDILYFFIWRHGETWEDPVLLGKFKM